MPKISRVKITCILYMCFGHETPRFRLVFAHRWPITHEQVVHSSSGNLFVLHRGGSGKSLIVLFHQEPERDSPLLATEALCQRCAGLALHAPVGHDTEPQHDHLHYAIVVEAQSSAVGAQGIEVRAELQKGTSNDNW
jgi:hypothetical protein